MALPSVRAFSAALVLSLVATLPAGAAWVWTPEHGWKNPDKKVPSTPTELFAESNEAFEARRFPDAVRGYQMLQEMFPVSIEAQSAGVPLLDAQFLAKDFPEALETADRLLSQSPGPDSATIRRILERKYQIGRAYLAGAPVSVLGIEMSGESRGVDILQDLAKKYPFQPFSDELLFSVGEYYFKGELYEDAEKVYRSLIADFPASPWAGLAEFQIGESAMRRVKGPEYDLRTLHIAEVSYERYLARYPGGEKTKEARQRLEEIGRLRAERLLLIARFYIKDHHPRAAIQSLQRILREYPNTEAARSAAETLREIRALEGPVPPEVEKPPEAEKPKDIETQKGKTDHEGEGERKRPDEQ